MPILPARRPPLQTKRQMIAKIARRPLGSVWRQARKTRAIGLYEMGWITRRRSPGVLIPKAKKRTQTTVAFSPRINAHSEIHTHILRPGYLSIPSTVDLVDFLKDVLRYKVRKWRIMSVTPKGIPSGMFYIRTRNRTASIEKIRALRNEMVRFLRKEGHSEIATAREEGTVESLFISRFLKLGIDLRIRPRPGFRFNGERFVRK